MHVFEVVKNEVKFGLKWALLLKRSGLGRQQTQQRWKSKGRRQQDFRDCMSYASEREHLFSSNIIEDSVGRSKAMEIITGKLSKYVFIQMPKAMWKFLKDDHAPMTKMSHGVQVPTNLESNTLIHVIPLAC
ncbi:hypothetical protein VNO77_34078 [Canavalia gladiata]|uniref:Uncharacterized protein n=1 Tax=Canavalia gladiata TaxID=3824 RepID=A0AAN9PYY6_CANGL